MGILDRWYDRDGVKEGILGQLKGNSRMYLFIYAFEYWNISFPASSAPFCRRAFLSFPT